MTASERARLQELVDDLPKWLAWRIAERITSWDRTQLADEQFVRLSDLRAALAACLAAEGEEDMSVQVADYEIALQRAAAIILKLRGCAEDEIDDQLIASLVDHELREPPAPPVASPASEEKP